MFRPSNSFNKPNFIIFRTFSNFFVSICRPRPCSWTMVVLLPCGCWSSRDPAGASTVGNSSVNRNSIWVRHSNSFSVWSLLLFCPQLLFVRSLHTFVIFLSRPCIYLWTIKMIQKNDCLFRRLRDFHPSGIPTFRICEFFRFLKRISNHSDFCFFLRTIALMAFHGPCRLTLMLLEPGLGMGLLQASPAGPSRKNSARLVRNQARPRPGDN